jgi:hypothetical protein
MQVDAPTVSPTPFAQPTQESQQGRPGRARIWVRFLSWYWGSSIIGLPILRIIHFAVCLGCIAARCFGGAGYLETANAALPTPWIVGHLRDRQRDYASLPNNILTVDSPDEYGRPCRVCGERTSSPFRVPRRYCRGSGPLNEVRSNLRFSCSGASRTGGWGICFDGAWNPGDRSKALAKKSALWDAMRSEPPGWTFISWSHHMDHPANLTQRLGAASCYGWSI